MSQSFSSPVTARVWVKNLFIGGASWNNEPDASPEHGIGGADFAATVGALGPNEGIYLTAQGSGDGSLYVNRGGSPFFFTPPTGFFPGWPGLTGLPDIWEPSSAQGSAVIAPDGHAVFPNFSGMIQGHTPWRFGQFYVEYNWFGDIFTSGVGMGVSRNMPDYNFFVGAEGRFNVADPNGGVIIGGGNIVNNYALSLGSQGVEIKAPGSLWTQLDHPVIGVAISISSSYKFRPARLHPIKLPGNPCCTVSLDPRWNKFVI